LVKDEKKKLVNVSTHELVPKHEILSKKEAEEILQKYHLRPHELPYIRLSDPAVAVLGAKPGDIVRIERKSSTAGLCFSYRYVIGQ
jgi:DNA-directed RNA polymerase subunit H